MEIFTFGLVVFTLVLLTVQIKKEKTSMRTLVWPYIMLLSMFVLVYPPVLTRITHLFAFTNTENLIFFIVCGYLFVITIVHEVRIAKLNDKINSLSRQLAINSKEQDDSNSND